MRTVTNPDCIARPGSNQPAPFSTCFRPGVADTGSEPLRCRANSRHRAREYFRSMALQHHHPVRSIRIPKAGSSSSREIAAAMASTSRCPPAARYARSPRSSSPRLQLSPPRELGKPWLPAARSATLRCGKAAQRHRRSPDNDLRCPEPRRISRCPPPSFLLSRVSVASSVPTPTTARHRSAPRPLSCKRLSARIRSVCPFSRESLPTVTRTRVLSPMPSFPLSSGPA